MVFHRARKKEGYNKILIKNTEISSVRSTKFLGVIIDDKLNWKEHIQYIKNKISKSIGILYKVRPYLCTGTLRNLYFSFTYPYLIYCNEVWGNKDQDKDKDTLFHVNITHSLKKTCKYNDDMYIGNIKLYKVEH